MPRMVERDPVKRSTYRYRFATTCPKCGNEGEIGCDDPSPTVCCGECLMERCEIVNLRISNKGN